MFVYFVLLILSFSRYGGSAPPMAKYNCQERCGNVTIPYPFGIGDGCFKDKWFEVACEVKPVGEVPILKSYQLNVLNIKFHDLQVSVDWHFSSCLPGDSGIQSILKPKNYDTGTYNPFTISPVNNVFIGHGCGIFAYVSNKMRANTTINTKGCISLCPEKTEYGIPGEIQKRACLGIGCCQASIPNGLKSIYVNVFNLHVNASTDAMPCSRAFVTEKPFLGYNGTQGLPMLMKWVIGNTTCEEANNTSSDQSCGKNSHCINYAEVGHRCQCNNGFIGNPYLSEGCKDVDECLEKSNKHCPEGTTCVNTEGSFFCLCPPGADPRNYNKTCVRNDQRRPVQIIYLGLGAGLSVTFSTALSIIGASIIKRKRQAKIRKFYFKRNGGLLLHRLIDSQEDAVVKTQIFAFEELQRATDNFNRGRICGKGGCGSVYKGMLSDGRIVAIKRSHVMHEKQVGNFINEVVILSRINHRNIVKLLGCCLETEVPLLVYEFIVNGTLSHHIIYEQRGGAPSLSWEVRVRIAGEIAGALAYLHSSVSVPVFHRDVKSSNILLDHNYNAKISDFGISRSIPVEKTHLTTTLQGTFGYLDPQYFRSKQLTDKSDVYSFGVVLVELLTGESAGSKTKAEREEKSLVLNFLVATKEDRLFDIMDDNVRREARREDAVDFAGLAKRCLKLKLVKRPTMKEVAVELERIRRQLGS